MRIFGKAGAGHFVKMVHNGIEYGMMQSIAEGFALMKKSPFKLNLQNVAQLYNRGSVIESRLVGWLESGYRKFGEELKAVSGSVAYTGEGEWTVKTGKKWKMKLPVIEDSFKFRVRSKKSPELYGKDLVGAAQPIRRTFDRKEVASFFVIPVEAMSSRAPTRNPGFLSSGYPTFVGMTILTVF